MGRDRELKWLAFSLYPLSFFLYSPFKGFPFTITLRQRPKGVPWGQQWIKRQRERMRITPLCFAKIQYLYYTQCTLHTSEISDSSTEQVLLLIIYIKTRSGKSTKDPKKSTYKNFGRYDKKLVTFVTPAN